MKLALALLFIALALPAHALDCKGQSYRAERGVARCVPLTKEDIEQRMKDAISADALNKQHAAEEAARAAASPAALLEKLEALQAELEALKSKK
jgi:dephospho-CoA kinase